MKRILLAFKAFFKAFREPAQAALFLLPEAPAAKCVSLSDQTHLQLLTLLQQSGRLIDFLKEDLSGFNDAQIGGAVRKIHQDCGKLLEDLVTIRPIREEAEGAVIQIQAGYDASKIKVVGNVQGEPPFSGILMHKGWKAHKRSLPKTGEAVSSEIICPAEVEVQS